MKNIQLPNYDKSLLSVTSSILKYYGYKQNHKSLEILDRYLKDKYKNVVLVLLDGLGSQNLNELSPSGIINKNKVSDILSTYPPTTVAATSTIESGLSPIEHCWLGWTLYFHEFDRRINIFPYVDCDTAEKLPLEGFTGKDILEYENIYEKISKATNKKVNCYTFHPEKIIHTHKEAINCNYSDIADMFNKVKEVCNNKELNYIYAYHSEPDYSMHEYGSNNDTIKTIVLEIEEQLEKFLVDLKDTLVIVLADHGHIDCELINLIDIPGFFDCLEKPPSLEGRTKSLFVKVEKKNDFLSLYDKYLKDDFLLFTKEEVLNKKLFGEGKKHKKFDDFVGNYLLCASSNKALVDTIISKNSFVAKSYHAGMTKREMLVPLTIFRK